MNKKQEVIVWMVSLYLLFVVVFYLGMSIGRNDYSSFAWLVKMIPEILIFTLPAIVISALVIMSLRGKK